MTQSSNDLSQELIRISDSFTHLGERLLGAARQLHAPGAPPPEGLIDELARARHDFIQLRDHARARADALEIAVPEPETLDTIQGLTAILDLVAESEVHQAKAEERRRRAVAVLDRVLQLQHSGDGAFEPLRACQDQARDLRDTVVQGAWSALPPETEPLSEGDHPFVHLLTLVEDREVLDDDLWAQLHDAVGATFGKSLAAAAARAKLVLSDDSSADGVAAPQGATLGQATSTAN